MPTYNFKTIRVVPSNKDFIDIILSKTQRQTPTVVHNGWAIQRIRAFYMRKVSLNWSLYRVLELGDDLCDLGPHLSKSAWTWSVWASLDLDCMEGWERSVWMSWGSVYSSGCYSCLYTWYTYTSLYVWGVKPFIKTSPSLISEAVLRHVHFKFAASISMFCSPHKRSLVVDEV